MHDTMLLFLRMNGYLLNASGYSYRLASQIAFVKLFNVSPDLKCYASLLAYAHSGIQYSV